MAKKISSNDQRVLELQHLIDEKRAEIQKSRVRFKPVTSCNLEFEGLAYNIQVLSTPQLELLLIRLNLYRLSADDLGVSQPAFSGYEVRDWMADIRARLDILSVQSKETGLKLLEKKLEGLMSNDLRVSKELDDLVSSIERY